MTIRYLDLEDGSDAADGLSFANRKKTWLSASTGLAAGDEIRLIASLDPASIGAVTWTDNSRTFGLPAGLVKVVEDGVAGWVVTTNVTLGTGTGRKVTTGTTSQVANVSATFTTGKISYKTLPAPLDLSAFQALSFWLQTNVAAPLGSLELRLCSDTLGDVAVASAPFDDGLQTTGAALWSVMLKDFGGALPASVQSVAVYALTDPGTVSVRINNLIACKGKNDPQHLSHVSLIGKNTVQEPEWYPLQSFTDTAALTAGSRAVDESSVPKARPYRGTTETVDTFAFRPLLIHSSDANRALQVAGTVASPCKITGGWSRADMSTQTGVSWITGRYRYTAILDGGQKAYWNCDKIGFAHVAGSGLWQNWNGWNINLEGWIACDDRLQDSSTMSFDILYTFSCKQVWGMPIAFLWPGASPPAKGYIGRIHGGTVLGSAAYNSVTGQGDRIDVRVGQIDNCAGYGAGAGTQPNRAFLRGTVFGNNDQGDLFLGTTDMEITCHNCTLGSATKYSIAGVSRAYAAIIISAENGDPTKHTVARKHSVLTTDTAVRHSGSGVSWKLTLTAATAASSAAFPIEFKLGDVAVKAGIPVTVKCWLFRELLGAGIMIQDGWINGVSESRAVPTGEVGAWEQVALTFTPAVSGVVPIFGFAYGILASVWFDEMTVEEGVSSVAAPPLPVPHTYWRLQTGNVQGITERFGLGEVEMRAAAGGADQCSGGTAFSGQVNFTGRPPSQAFDNNTATQWMANQTCAADGSVLSDIGYQFPAPVHVNQLSLTSTDEATFSPKVAPTRLNVQWSDNGTQWFTAWTVENISLWSGVSQTQVFTRP